MSDEPRRRQMSLLNERLNDDLVVGLQELLRLHHELVDGVVEVLLVDGASVIHERQHIPWAYQLLDMRS